MLVNVLTPDSKMPNLAAMKISAYHKQLGDKVTLNFPWFAGTSADLTYASVLFQGTPDPAADLVGGPKYPEGKLPPEMDRMRPDYTLYPKIDYSMGYTYKACPRTCDFCIVPKQQNDDIHRSIWDFHDSRFKKICLMNNNTLADPSWRETFGEIIDAKLTIVDQNGYDARLITEEAASWFAKVRFEKSVHLAWDFIEHEIDVLTGICNLKKAIPSMFRSKRVATYVLIGHGSTPEEDLHRVLVLDAMRAEPFVMPYDRADKYQQKFARWVNARQIFKTVQWKDYRS